jgi:hypothetical protein
MSGLIQLEQARHAQPRSEHATDLDWTELASRQNDGLEIGLYWSQATDQAKVAVVDTRLGESFDLHVPRSEALSAFHHPFAYVDAAVPERSAA